ncbi:MAG: DNA polymerase IV [Alphaproteobacteria bacterium]|nr:DNA polymerase IV [Alphaproteobacteria bacterium]
MTRGLCRDCFATFDAAGTAPRCPDCDSPRVVHHAELEQLAIAHIDCDAFYASVEKRDDPSLRDKPVIVGGGKRGVVSACCYIARTYGVRSAMPMFKALKACPDAVVIRPDMQKYVAIGREIRKMMRDITPLVEPLSIDEAFLDLSGTERLHGHSPAATLAWLCHRIEADTGLTASVGLSYNKSLAKIASDLDKPRGFALIGRSEARQFLAGRPVSLIWGAGPALQRRLARDGVRTIGQLAAMDEADLVARYGSIGRRLAWFSRGEDDRAVVPDRPTKSVSAETTFDRDVAAPDALARILWRLSEKVSARLKAADLVGRTVTLKLKTADFRILTRNRSLAQRSQLAEVIYRTALPLLEAQCDGRAFRLLGVGVAGLAHRDDLDENPGLIDGLDPAADRAELVERTMDKLRSTFGKDAVIKGRGWPGNVRTRPGTGSSEDP